MHDLPFRLDRLPAATPLLAVLCAALLVPVARAGEVPAADELLRRSIEHHDPQGRFLSEPWCLSFRETRPGADDRRTEALIDVAGERFHLSRRAEHEVAGVIDGERCEMTLDGRPGSQLSAAEREQHRISCQRLRLLRDYYTYLWGLPMKLRDRGTHLGEVRPTTFMERPVYGLRVTYAPGVGEDTWYFYFDRDSAALVGYRFYHDESKNDGEFIVLDGEHEAHGLRLPESRAWYTHQDDRHLGTDVLVGVERCPRRVSASGRPRIDARRLAALDFDARGLATTWIDGSWSYVKPDGTLLAVVTWDNGPDDFSEGLVRTVVGGKIAYADEGLEVVVAPRFDWGWPFSNGLALVCLGCRLHQASGDEHTEVIGGTWGYIDRRGDLVVPLQPSRQAAVAERGARRPAPKPR